MRFKQGFTLIELIIAIFVLAVGIVGVLYMFPMGTQIGKSAQMATTATQLGQAKIEELVSKSYGEVSSSTEAYGKIPGFEAYKRITAVDYYDPVNAITTSSDTGIKKVAITVFWKSPLGVTEKSINLVSLIAKR